MRRKASKLSLADYQRVGSRTYKQTFLALHDAYVAIRAEKAAALKEASVFRAYICGANKLSRSL